MVVERKLRRLLGCFWALPGAKTFSGPEKAVCGGVEVDRRILGLNERDREHDRSHGCVRGL